MYLSGLVFEDFQKGVIARGNFISMFSLIFGDMEGVASDRLKTRQRWRRSDSQPTGEDRLSRVGRISFRGYIYYFLTFKCIKKTAMACGLKEARA